MSSAHSKYRAQLSRFWYIHGPHINMFVLIVGVFVLLIGLSVVRDSPWTLFFILPLALVFLCLVFNLVHRGHDYFSEYVGRTIVAVGLVFGVAVVSSILMAAEEGSPGAWKNLQVINLTRTGTLLALFMALITVLGFGFTITRLQEIHIRISDYGRLLLRLERMIDQLHKENRSVLPRNNGPHSRNKEATSIKILCSVPTLGNVSHYYHNLYTKWRKIANAPNICVEMVCVDPRPVSLLPGVVPSGFLEFALGYDYDREDFSQKNQKYANRLYALNSTPLGRFYLELQSAKNYSEPEILRGFVQAFDVIYHLSIRSRNNDVSVYSWPLARSHPPFHLFLTRDRAIVAVPLDRNVSADAAPEDVELIGYETTDRSVVSRLNKVFDEWKKELNVKTLTIDKSHA